MIGVDYHEVVALPHSLLRQVLEKYNRLSQQNIQERL